MAAFPSIHPRVSLSLQLLPEKLVWRFAALSTPFLPGEQRTMLSLVFSEETWGRDERPSTTSIPTSVY